MFSLKSAVYTVDLFDIAGRDAFRFSGRWDFKIPRLVGLSILLAARYVIWFILCHPTPECLQREILYLVYYTSIVYGMRRAGSLTTNRTHNNLLGLVALLKNDSKPVLPYYRTLHTRISRLIPTNLAENESVVLNEVKRKNVSMTASSSNAKQTEQYTYIYTVSWIKKTWLKSLII